MIICDYQKLSQAVKDRFYLDTISDDIKFNFNGTKDLSFLSETDLPKEKIMKVNSDYLLLFPYKEDKSLSFSGYGILGKNIFLIDVLPQKEYPTLSPYRIKQYEDKLKEEMNRESLEDEDFSLLNDFLHQRVEKQQLFDFLKGEKELQSSAYRFYELLLLNGSIDEMNKCSTFIYITKKLMKSYIENLGLIEEGSNKNLVEMRLNPDEK